MRTIYPDGMERAIGRRLIRLLPSANVQYATLADPDVGLPAHVLDATEVLVWWGHLAHEQVPDALVDRIHARVLGGMGLIVLHSAHFSKPFTRLMGTTCSLGWRNEGEREVVWNVAPTHPITRNVGAAIVLDQHETYGEYFDVPRPDDVIFISNSAGGEAFRSGLTFTRGRGKIFYLSPGYEDYPVFHSSQIQQVLANAAEWVTPDMVSDAPEAAHRARDWFAAAREA